MTESVDFRQRARKRWGKQAAWIKGDGQYALLARCNVLTITLWEELAKAKARKKLIDETACGKMCSGSLGHKIVDLEASNKSQKANA